jgi:hypothetical protein
MLNFYKESIICGMVVALLLLTMAFFILVYSFHRIKQKLDDVTNFVYQLMRYHEEDTTNIATVSKMSNTTNETLSTLTSSIRSVMKKVQHDNNEKIYPGPQLLDIIDKCITENVLMYASLIKNDPMPENAITWVSNIVVQTFPHVQTNYLIQRTTYIIEEFNNSQTGRKAQ